MSTSDDDRGCLMAEGRLAFNRGDFFLAHERWEEVWGIATGPDRRWLQGMIQVAAGLHHLAHGRKGPATKCLGRGLDKLGDAPDRLDGIDVTAARRGAERMLEAIARGELADPSTVSLP